MCIRERFWLVLEVGTVFGLVTVLVVPALVALAAVGVEDIVVDHSSRFFVAAEELGDALAAYGLLSGAVTLEPGHSSVAHAIGAVPWLVKSGTRATGRLVGGRSLLVRGAFEV